MGCRARHFCARLGYRVENQAADKAARFPWMTGVGRRERGCRRKPWARASKRAPLGFSGFNEVIDCRIQTMSCGFNRRT